MKIKLIEKVMYIDFKYRFGFLLNGRKRKSIALTSVLPLIQKGMKYFLQFANKVERKVGRGCLIISYNILLSLILSFISYIIL